jgi:hypothetical protein
MFVKTPTLNKTFILLYFILPIGKNNSFKYISFLYEIHLYSHSATLHLKKKEISHSLESYSYIDTFVSLMEDSTNKTDRHNITEILL